MIYGENLKYLVKRAIWSLNKHNSDRRDIFLFTSRRSGGTYLMKIIGSDPGTKYVREPFIYARKDPTAYKRLPTSMQESAWLKPNKDGTSVRKFIEAVQKGSLHVEEPWNIFGLQHNFRSERVVIKMHNVKHWMPWFLENFPEAHFVYLIRHPIPQALSAMRLQETEPDVRHVAEVQKSEWLHNSNVLKVYNRILESGTELEKYVLRYLLENEIPYRLVKNRKSKITTITYEQLVYKLDDVLELFESSLNISKKNANKLSNKDSGTSRNSKTKNYIENKDKEKKVSYLVGRWTEEINRSQKKSIKKILYSLNFKWYKTDSVWPSQEIWIKGS